MCRSRRGIPPGNFQRREGLTEPPPPPPNKKNSKFTNSYTRRKVTKNLMNFINLKTSWLAFINQGPLVIQSHTIHSSWPLGSLSSTGTLISISLVCISFYTDVVKYLNGVKTSQNFNINIFNSHLFSRNVLLVLNQNLPSLFYTWKHIQEARFDQHETNLYHSFLVYIFGK